MKSHTDILPGFSCQDPTGLCRAPAVDQAAGGVAHVNFANADWPCRSAARTPGGSDMYAVLGEFGFCTARLIFYV